MLPKQITELIDGFVHAYEAQHPARLEFQKERNRELMEALVHGSAGWSSAIVVRIARRVAAHVKKECLFVWEKFKEVILATEPESYPALNEDVKGQISKYVNPTVEIAERFL